MKRLIFLVFLMLIGTIAFAKFQTDDLTITNLKNKAALATDANGKLITGSGASQTPWTSDIDAANYSLGSVNHIIIGKSLSNWDSTSVLQTYGKINFNNAGGGYYAEGVQSFHVNDGYYADSYLQNTDPNGAATFGFKNDAGVELMAIVSGSTRGALANQVGFSSAFGGVALIFQSDADYSIGGPTPIWIQAGGYSATPQVIVNPVTNSVTVNTDLNVSNNIYSNDIYANDAFLYGEIRANGHAQNVTSQYSVGYSYWLTANDDLVLGDPNFYGTINIYLPCTYSAPTGRTYTIKNIAPSPSPSSFFVNTSCGDSILDNGTSSASIDNAHEIKTFVNDPSNYGWQETNVSTGY